MKVGKVVNIKGLHHKPDVIYETLTAPDSDVTVAAGGTATITVSVAGEVERKIDYAGIESISGLPTDIVIESFSFDKDAKTLSITVYNRGSGDVTISAGSLTIKVLSVA